MLSPCYAYDYKKIAPKAPPELPPAQSAAAPAKEQPTGADTLLVPELRSIVLAAPEAKISEKEWKNWTGVHAKDTLHQLPEPKELVYAVAAFTGKPLHKKDLDRLLGKIVEIYTDQNRPVVAVTLPPQDITDGALRIDITEAVLGKIHVNDGKWFSGKAVKEGISLKSQQPIDSGELLQNLTWLNSNPFRRVDAVFTQGKKPGESDIELNIVDRRPLRVYSGYENTGSDTTDRNRYLAGFNWGKVFGTEADILSYQFTMAPDYQTLSGHSFQYQSLLPWHHLANFYGSYSEVSPQLGNNLHSEGTAWQLGGRYTIPTYSGIGGLTQSFILGGDFKRTNNNLDFGGTLITDSQIDTATVMAGYRGDYIDGSSTTSLNAEMYFSPGNITAYNEQRYYQQARQEADPRFSYLKATLTETYTLENQVQLAGLVNAQWSGDSLLSGEQLGLGGYNSIRGYSDHQVITDKGVIISLEARTPAISLLDMPNVPDALSFLTFMDYGIGMNNNRLTGEPDALELWSAGLGMRYNVASYASLRFDYGWRLTEEIQPRDRRGNPHLGLIVSY